MVAVDGVKKILPRIAKILLDRYPKSGGWRRGKRLKQLKRPGISTAAYFTLLVTTDFVAIPCSYMAKWR